MNTVPVSDSRVLKCRAFANGGYQSLLGTGCAVPYGLSNAPDWLAGETAKKPPPT